MRLLASSTFVWNEQVRGPGIVLSPVLEPTPENPKGVYGQLKGSGTCIPGDLLGELEDGTLHRG